LLAAAEAFADGTIDKVQLAAAEHACEYGSRAPNPARTPWLDFERDAVTAVLLAQRTETGGRLGALRAAAHARAGAAVWNRHVQALGGILRIRPGEFAPLEEAVRRCDRAFLTSELSAEYARQAELLRDIIGNPFRTIAIDGDWLTRSQGSVGRIARSIYESRRFQDVPILADALEDVGCTDAEILSHCRSGGPHVRGCRVIDHLLGKG
jgi:hypothetical protein